MKTLENLYEEIMTDDALKKEAVAAVKEQKTGEFLKAHDCAASLDEAAAFLKEKELREGEIPDNALEMVSGGCAEPTNILII